MSGNCATGMANIARRPASVITIEITKAKRGRSMKMLEIISWPLAALGGQGRLLHDLTRPHLLDAVDDHLVAFAQARGDDDVGVEVRPGLDAAHLHLVLSV